MKANRAVSTILATQEKDTHENPVPHNPHPSHGMMSKKNGVCYGINKPVLQLHRVVMIS